MARQCRELFRVLLLAGNLLGSTLAARQSRADSAASRDSQQQQQLLRDPLADPAHQFLPPPPPKLNYSSNKPVEQVSPPLPSWCVLAAAAEARPSGPRWKWFLSRRLAARVLSSDDGSSDLGQKQREIWPEKGLFVPIQRIRSH